MQSPQSYAGPIRIRTVLGQFLKEDPGKETDPLDVLPGFQAPVLNDRGQGVHQHVIGLLQLMGLLVHHVLQVMLMQVKLNDIMYAPLHHMRFKWLYNDVRGAQVKGTQFPSRELSAVMTTTGTSSRSPLPPSPSLPDIHP